MKDIAILKSKKASMACVAALLSYVCLKNGLSTEQAALVVSPILAYIPIQGAIDHKNTPKPKAE